VVSRERFELEVTAAPKEGRRRGRPPASEPAVLEAAIGLVRTIGVSRVTMEAIAKRAGVTKITLYRRWPSKAALLAEALLSELRQAAPLDATASPKEAIAMHVAAFVRGLGGPLGELLRGVVAESLTDPVARLAFRDRYLGLRRLAAIQIIKRGLADGTFDATGPAEDRHDELYGALFYRFLFQVGALDEAAALRLVQDVLNPKVAASLTHEV
jgi:AcrR family transcriptional regulator